MPNFAVLHVNKGKIGTGSGLGTHIDRLRETPNANELLSGKNLSIFPATNGEIICAQRSDDALKMKAPLQQRINERIKEGYTGKTAIRKDAVTHLKIILTGSHDRMKEIERDKIALDDWYNDNYDFARKQWGEKNIVDFTMHLDEKTPHIHCVVVPLTEDGRLTAKEVLGDKRKMKEQQTQYAQAMSKYGLQRGIEGSKAKHDTIQEYYGRINQRIENKAHTFGKPTAIIPQMDTPPLVDREKWVERQNKRILDFGREMAEYTAQEFKNASNSLKTAETRAIQAEERTDRLRKENAQLRGAKFELEKQLNPEQYQTKREEARKEQSTGRGLRF